MKFTTQLKVPSLGLKVSKKIIQEFHKRAKTNFPNEMFAFFIGTTGDDLTITECFFPTDVEKYCYPNRVDVQNSWYIEVKKYCKEHELFIISDCHSHPYNKKQTKIYRLAGGGTDTSPSEQDWNSSVDNDHMMAICLLTECKDGKLRARTKFWGPLTEIKVKETK